LAGIVVRINYAKSRALPNLGFGLFARAVNKAQM
jgi:hypothetical protein